MERGEFAVGMPRCLGGSEEAVHVSQVDYIVEGTNPALAEMPAPGTASDIDEAVAKQIVDQIPNGACLQLGIGGMPNAVGSLIAKSDLKGEGHTVVLPEEVHSTLDKRTDPNWPTTWFAPRLTGQGAFEDVYSVMANWGANHGAFTYGHMGDKLITLCSMLRIPVSMHNVESGRVFRPQAWQAFGTADAEGADYRACQTYGPLYR